MKKISSTEIILLFYIILMPFSLFSPTKFGVNIKLCDFIFPFLFLSFIIERRKNLLNEIGKSSVLFVFLLFIASGLISMLNSIDIRKSVLELSGYLYLLTLAVIVVSSTESMEHFYRLIKVWLLTTGVVLVIGLLGTILFFMNKPTLASQLTQFSTLDKTFTFFPRTKATFYTPNMLLTYLHVSIVLGMAYFYRLIQKAPLKNFKASSVLIFIIFISIGAFSTLSRRFPGVLLSLFLILRKFSQKRVLLYLKHILFLLFIVFLVLSFLTTVWQVFPLVNTKLSFHFLRYPVALRMFLLHPIIGNGIGTFTLIFPNFYEPEKVISRYEVDIVNIKDAVMNRTHAADPHCLYTGVLAEQGAIGFLALILFFILLYLYIQRAQKHVKHKPDRNAIYILTCGLTGFLLNGLTIDLLTMRHFWFLLALTMALISICNGENA